ncbi:MAG: 50S ribosomal protein L25 [Candidatus Mariimomonas ferrooxydans]
MEWQGKGSARSLRRSDILPAVLYAKGFSTPIKLHKKDVLSKLMVSGKSEHALVTIELSGGKDKKTDHWVLVKDYQLDPVRNELLHVDFIEISLKKKIKTTVPVVVTEEPAGVKKGGILQQQLRDVEIECLPTQIPDGMEVDASAVDIGHSLHVSDLKIKEGVKILSNPQDVILTVIAPVVEEVAPVPAEEEAAEPEVTKQGKSEAEVKEAEEKDQKGQKEQKKK